MKHRIKKVGVIGAGVMGAGIAALIANTGNKTVLLDIVPGELSEEEKEKGIGAEDPRHLNRFAEAGKSRIADAKTGVLYLPEMADYITVGNLDTNLELLRECDWVIEVVAENLDIKHSLFEKIAPFINNDAILSTNTSGIPICDIAAGMTPQLKKRFLGTHFFNPPTYMRLLEIIPTEDTDQEVVQEIKDFGTQILGKGIIEAKDTMGFIANRVGGYSTPALLELMEKYQFDFEMVDYLTGTLIGRPKMATFRLLDLVGIDLMAKAKVDSDQPKELPEYLTYMIENNQLGNKTGKGFYKREVNEDGEKEFLVWDREKKEYVSQQNYEIPFIKECRKIKVFPERLRKLVYSDEPEGQYLWDYFETILIKSAQAAEEIAYSYTDIDKAMRWGYNWNAGPFEVWDMLGVEEAAAKMRQRGLTIPDWVEERITANKPFYEHELGTDSLSWKYPLIKKMEHSWLLDMGDGVVALEVHSPGNSITDALRDEIWNAVDEVEKNAKYEGLVILNNRDNFFLTGADIKGMMGKVMSASLDSPPELVYDSVAAFQKTSMKLKYSQKPVIAAIHGMVLGGGLEYSIHASRIVAHVDTYMGLVEAGVGIVPGGGGIKEMLLRAIADSSTFDEDDPIPALQKYWELIATAQVSKNAYMARSMGYLRPTDIIIAQIDSLPERAKEEVLKMANDGFRQKTPVSVKVPGSDCRGKFEQRALAMLDGGYIFEHDFTIAMEIASAITGGEVPKGTTLSEEELLKLEQIGTSKLLRTEKTLARLWSMAESGRPVRN